MWLALDTSRGVEMPGSKVYMHAMVLTLDALVYVPALVWFVRTWHANRYTCTQVCLPLPGFTPTTNTRP